MAASKYLSTSDAVLVFGIPRSQLIRFIRDGKVAYTRNPGAKKSHIQIDRESLRACLADAVFLSQEAEREQVEYVAMAIQELISEGAPTHYSYIATRCRGVVSRANVQRILKEYQGQRFALLDARNTGELKKAYGVLSEGEAKEVSPTKPEAGSEAEASGTANLPLRTGKLRPPGRGCVLTREDGSKTFLVSKRDFELPVPDGVSLGGYKKENGIVFYEYDNTPPPVPNPQEFLRQKAISLPVGQAIRLASMDEVRVFAEILGELGFPSYYAPFTTPETGQRIAGFRVWKLLPLATTPEKTEPSRAQESQS